ncbi:hypothetical protein TpMuguga_04g00086 [Theileria parva strain Muguga]|uniref:Uncharacterized protein n=1 Tax=Theileria parva TaxID=5875 RepID=Q4N3A1_THEPA|nr:uncharacterized protein TpMuguga_04g00086 [Theileria parva strain Muguga]EAN31438.1 hypothetical protein TpMuguga_04g00086 [Theileria parva strain Muguga]|eukprot:XP_763721.1 hypothetical protein [Theileria parva strain Muguga]
MATEVQYKADLINGKPVLYCRYDFEHAWEDVTHTRHQLDHLELYDLNLNLTGVSQCSTELCDTTFKISIDFKCYHVKLGDKLLWSYYEFPQCGLPKKLLFNLKLNTMALQFEETIEKLNLDGYEFNDWVEPGRPLQPIITRKKIINGHIKVDLFSPWNPCVQVNFDETHFWRHKQGNPLPISLIHELEDYYLLVFPDAFLEFDFYPHRKPLQIFEF